MGCLSWFIAIVVLVITVEAIALAGSLLIVIERSPVGLLALLVIAIAAAVLTPLRQSIHDWLRERTRR
jgi:hypothetical protein